MKEYPLEVRAAYEFEGYALLNYYSRGHHDAESFVAAIKDYHDVSLPASDVVLSWWRAVPVGGQKGVSLLHPAKPNSRGSFPVTVLEV